MKKYQKELKTLQETYFKALAYHETIKEIEKESKIKVLADHVFLVEKGFTGRGIQNGERITDHTEDFLMSDEDFTRYCKLVYEEEKKQGLNKLDYNTTADYESRKLLKMAEECLLDFSIKISPKKIQGTLEKAKTHWKHRKEMLDLVLKLDLSK